MELLAGDGDGVEVVEVVCEVGVEDDSDAFGELGVVGHDIDGCLDATTKWRDKYFYVFKLVQDILVFLAFRIAIRIFYKGILNIGILLIIPIFRKILLLRI